MADDRRQQIAEVLHRAIPDSLHPVGVGFKSHWRTDDPPEGTLTGYGQVLMDALLPALLPLIARVAAEAAADALDDAAADLWKPGRPHRPVRGWLHARAAQLRAAPTVTDPQEKP